jgi:hypothetical protein
MINFNIGVALGARKVRYHHVLKALVFNVVVAAPD